MRLSPIPSRPRLSDEGGFSMVVVMVVLLIGGMLATAALSAANSDLPFGRDAQDRKSAYAAAEAGVSYYAFRLNQDPDYWTRCDTVPAPSPDPNPVNQVNTNPRRWRTVADATSQYAIELLPASGFTACQTGNQNSMLDPSTGTFRVRATGRPREGARVKRSINLTFRRKSFLDFLYFTSYETTDPDAYPESPSSGLSRTTAAQLCGDRVRSQRASECGEIRFPDSDRIVGPLHTNDESVLTCGSPVFGERADDAFEVTGGGSGFVTNCSGTAPRFVGKVDTSAPTMQMPQTNATLASQALPGYSFEGRTEMHFTGSTMAVRNLTRWPDGGWRTMNLPANGVIYVSTPGTCPAETPMNTAYKDGPGCGNAYVSGTYRSNLTIGAANDIIVAPTQFPAIRSFVRDSASDAVAGLIAENFVRVYNRVTRSDPSKADQCDSADPAADVRIDAAILSLKHSFIVDNYTAWNPADPSKCPTRGTLSVHGAIAQKYRGPVGITVGSVKTGFFKNYTYDRRMRFRSPPYFMEPVASAWRIVRRNEQVPAS